MSGERITIDDSMFSAIAKLSEGNPGALRVSVELFKYGPGVDPDAALGGLAPLLSLDTHNIYGPDIWMLYKDVCGGSYAKMMAMLRACQLGLMQDEVLKEAIAGRSTIDVDAIAGQVKERLPNFNLDWESSESMQGVV